MHVCCRYNRLYSLYVLAFLRVKKYAHGVNCCNRFGGVENLAGDIKVAFGESRVI